MLHQFNLFLLLFGALQGGLLSLWFLKNRRNEPANLYLGLLLGVVGLQLTLKVITKAWLFEHVRFLYLVSYQLPYLVGPLLWGYATANRTGRFVTRAGWHLLPFGLILGLIGVQMAFPYLVREPHPFFGAVLQSLSLAGYGWLAGHRAGPPVRRFVRSVAVAEFVIILTLALMVVYHGRFPDVRLLFLVLTGLIYRVSYQVIARTGPFVPAPTPGPSFPALKLPKYARSSLKPTEADRIERALHRLLHEDRLFLDPSLTIDALAEKLGTSRHHLSQVLNERLQQSYADCLTGLRLDEARRRLSDPAHFRYTIAAIAFDSGFNSLASFNDAFRRRYGTTPSRFREPFIKKVGV